MEEGAKLLSNAHRRGATIVNQVKAEHIWKPGGSKYSFLAERVSPRVPPACRPTGSPCTDGPCGAELFVPLRQAARTRKVPVEAWPGLHASGGGGASSGSGFSLKKCLRDLGFGTGTALSVTNGVATRQPAVPVFAESWSTKCARRRRRQEHGEVQVARRSVSNR